MMKRYYATRDLVDAGMHAPSTMPVAFGLVTLVDSGVAEFFADARGVDARRGVDDLSSEIVFGDGCVCVAAQAAQVKSDAVSR